ncbi:MAG: DEAD/DEAH box helicase family protein [Clostridia bacterium]|nr:DEAD/DEAH box helicase family protein [Clostridia bacterium]
MIDKNDVKMPVQRDDIDELLGDEDKMRGVEDLLALVGNTPSEQKLRLKQDYYGRFNWFGLTRMSESAKKSYFSYQEEAVYDFIFNLNKSGILSDQVGMGKTIEAGMIISELASRNELRSLLIIVPNEIMANKWEDELKHKFGIDEYTNTEEVVGEDGVAHRVERKYPVVKALKSYDDFCRCVFDCLVEENFYDLAAKLKDHGFNHDKYEVKEGDTLGGVIEGFVKEDIKLSIDLINRGFMFNDIDATVVFDGKKFAIVGTDFAREYVYDSGNAIKEYLKLAGHRANNTASLKRILQSQNGLRNRYDKIIRQELNGLFTLVGEFFTTLEGGISSVSDSMINNYPILVIPIAYSEHTEGGGVKLHEFLNRTLRAKTENYKHEYIIQDDNGENKPRYEEYRIVDFFIDVAYQTIIVDEVHDYIDVCAKMDRDQFHRGGNGGYRSYPSSEYNRYELFDDYYFIKKSSLYKKLKSLADNANRKIFLTATPIKSDMVDFYLLTLLASNKDSEMYKKIKAQLDVAFLQDSEREEAIKDLYYSFENGIGEAAKHFSQFHDHYIQPEEKGGAVSGGKYRLRYPYFGGSYLSNNYNRAEAIEQYLKATITYLSMEEVVMELITAYLAEKKTKNRDMDNVIVDIKQLIADLADLLSALDLDRERAYLRTRIVFRSLFNNSIKMRFEEDFTKPDGTPIKRIRELLETEDGPRKWHKTYRKYGIRHTRHQTYNLASCPEINKLRSGKRERYLNLPIWPRRDGKVIFLVRDDIFFDCFQQVRRNHKRNELRPIKIEELPNFENLTGSEAEKAERFQTAVAIFDYINNAMSGGEGDFHEPSSSKYDSVEIDDAEMVDYKLALVSRLMAGSDAALGQIDGRVLLFAENEREKIVEWFSYIRYRHLKEKRSDGLTPEEQNEFDGYEQTLSNEMYREYERKWARYGVPSSDWYISENAGVLEILGSANQNLLIIIDPKRYEKGVDLQKANTIINFDINYCPLKMEQRIGRIDRIRPSGQKQEINIISFVPLNDMSGYVINFFANELKMFTQWMGETTGIVSVPEEEKQASGGEDVSFEGKVYKLEEYYKFIYDLCKNEVSQERIKEMATAFRRFFSSNRAHEKKVDEAQAQIDFEFIQELRKPFDTMFRNSISPKREGNEIHDREERVVRFNTVLGGSSRKCYALSCKECEYKNKCRGNDSQIKNKYSVFADAIKSFLTMGEKFYNSKQDKMHSPSEVISGASKETLLDYLRNRAKAFKAAKSEIKKLLPDNTNDPFTMPFEEYSEIFGKLKKLYWDDVVAEYINRIIDRFHRQCDSVLEGASLFERFIKTLSIADFMNNMEGVGNER